MVLFCVHKDGNECNSSLFCILANLAFCAITVAVTGQKAQLVGQETHDGGDRGRCGPVCDGHYDGHHGWARNVADAAVVSPQ